MRSARRLAVTSALCLSLLAACGDDTSKDTADDGAARTGDCEWLPDGEPAVDGVETPDEAAEPATSFVLETNAGDVPIELDPAKVCAATSFTSLAEQGYWDDSPCHRMSDAEQVPFGILQCGDPTGTGTGGPGYTFAEELTGDETYREGTVAMAKTQEPDSSGGQFFLNYADSDFPPDYTEFGTISDEGLDVLRTIAADGVEGGGADGPPASPLVIESVRVED